MAGNNRASAWRNTMLRKHGSEDALSDYLAELGARGGRKRGPKGFAISGLQSKAGRRGGMAKPNAEQRKRMSEAQRKWRAEKAEGLR